MNCIIDKRFQTTNNINLLVKLKFGSHLYGTQTETSDTDYKGVFLPTLEDCILGNIKNSLNLSTGGKEKNGAKDIDEEYYSLQHFLLKLGKSGETVFLDMLHANETQLDICTELWRALRESRAMFYTKNMKSYLGYCVKQAIKYGTRGTRISIAIEVLKILNSYPENERLSVALNTLLSLPTLYTEISNPTPLGCPVTMLVILGKKFQDTCPIREIKKSLELYLREYGDRAKLAAENKGIDWKAISHAFRSGLQLKEIYETGDLKYPLKDKDFILNIKRGAYHYINDNIPEKLEALVDEIKGLAASSKYPEHIDSKVLNNFILKAYNLDGYSNKYT